ncbi:hypothetical protein PR003_g3827 [Phytophthora rubi]|uniref:K Homology domain-containing protein n=1 Tax=Phytophthora rubi TaxID=129364 RepID=A0A6A4FWN4_9STRA|nr:hypothetical protein PR001_g3464 [Phytophthora rubi]KAE9353499.1 hypothetical protein PR003_g3827 [Phytophthora rubi]
MEIVKQQGGGVHGEGSSSARMKIPAHAVGVIIGKAGVGMQYLKSITGITKCTLKATTLNEQLLTAFGTAEAIGELQRHVSEKLKFADRQLSNRSRKEHSWTLTKNNNLRTPREVHHTGKAAPRRYAPGVGNNHHHAKKQAKKIEKEKELAAHLRELKMKARS